MTEPLEQRILNTITEHQNTKGYSPTFREIGDAVGLSAVSTVAYHIRLLVWAGKLRQGPHGSPRTLTVVTK
jgi:repressor LexA